MIKFGIISFAHMHANSYAWALQCIARDGGIARLVAIADPDATRAAQKSAEFQVNQSFASWQSMIDEAAVDAVIITSENSYHRDQVIACAKRGIHILCEKPVGINAEDLVQMHRSLQASTSIFQTAFVCRYSASVVEAKKIIDSGKLGRIKAISATNHGQHPGGWFEDVELSGGGAIIDHTVHAADVVRLLTGDEFGTVRAFRGSNIVANSTVEDSALLYCKLEKSGLPVSIDCSWSRHSTWPTWGDLVLNVFCEHGAIKIDAFKTHIDLAHKVGFEWYKLGENLNEKLIRGFCSAILESNGDTTLDGSFASNKELRADFRAGQQASMVALAAYESVSHSNATQKLRVLLCP